MRLLFFSVSFLFAWRSMSIAAFIPPKNMASREALLSSWSSSPSTSLFASDGTKSGVPNVDRMKELIMEETSDSKMMKAAANQMKNLTPDQIDAMIREMETMNSIQKQALKALGMDPDAMKATMKMMRDNPQMMKSAQKLMETMTPEQLMEQSRKAQELMKSMTPEQMEKANAELSSIPKEQFDQAVDILADQISTVDTVSINTITEDDKELATATTTIQTGPGTSSDPNVIAAMYKVAEFMSNDSAAIEKGIGGVSLAGFASLPAIQLLSGPRDEDLSPAELKECWANGSLGATRVDLQGFERVWKEVQEYFEEDIMGEARKEAKKHVSSKMKRGAMSAAQSPSSADSASIARSGASSTPMVGASLNEEQLAAANEQFKSMSDEDMATMFASIEKMDPAMEARLKAMGTDPNMLRQTAKLMNSNPIMRKAAKEMIKNMSGKDMLKVSQQAQEEMKKMSPDDIQKMMDMDPAMQEALKNMSMEEIQEAMRKGKLS